MNKKIHSLALLVNLGIYGVALPAMADDNTASAQHEDTMVITAAEQNLQAPGVSTITADEIRKNPPARDVAEIIRTMPGVNLTGNSTSGQRGNNRQIDIRGMGPENTLILIDGKPVTSRNSIRLGWRGERDTRGDTGWVPPEMIERIEVIRGPAAARYGNGAAGGVVNIITKKFDDQWHGSWNTYLNAPEHKDEGSTKRTNFSLSGPLGGDFSFRMFGNLDKTQAMRGTSTRVTSLNVPVPTPTPCPQAVKVWKTKTSTAWCAGTSHQCSRWSLKRATAARTTCMRATRRTPTTTTRW